MAAALARATPLSREYGLAGVGVMLVPAWDFTLDRLWRGHMAVMRGVESGFSVVRAAKQGYLTVSDSRGRILAEATSDSAPFATLVADVPEHALSRARRLVRVAHAGRARRHDPAARPAAESRGELTTPLTGLRKRTHERWRADDAGVPTGDAV